MQKKRLYICLVVAAAFLLLAFAECATADTDIFDDSVLPGYHYTTSTGESFVVTYGSSKESILVTLPSESLIIQNHSCSSGNQFKGCYSGATFTGTYNRSQPDPEVYSFSLKLTMLEPKIDVTKEIDQPEVNAGQEATVRVNITNTGSMPTTVQFSETVPEGLKISELPNQPCKRSASNGNKLVLDSELKAGELKLCSYKVSGAKPGAYSLISSVGSAATALSTLTVKPLPFSLSVASPQQLTLGEKTNITFMLNSTDQLDYFAFSAHIPSSLKSSLMTTGATLQNNGDGLDVTYNAAILNGSLAIEVSSEATGVGLSSITAEASWLYNGSREDLATNFPISVSFASPYLRVLSQNPETGKVLADIVNPSNLPITGVSVSSSLFSGSTAPTVGVITAFGDSSFEVIPPEPGNYTGMISYSTKYGQKLQSAFSLAVNVSARLPSPPAPEEVQEQKAPDTANATTPQNQTAPANDNLASVPKSKQGIMNSPEIKVGGFLAAAILIIVLFFVSKNRRKIYA